MTETQQHLWQKVEKYSPILRHIPFIKMLAICNSLTFGTASKDSDIDLFIIAKQNRLFTVRLLITILTQLLGIRRHGTKIKARFCLSFFIDETHLNLEPIAIKNDIYLAHWLQNLTPIISDHNTIKNFQTANQWSEKLLNKKLQIKTQKIIGTNNSILLKHTLKGKLGDLIEKKLKKWQLNRATKKSTGNPNILIKHNILKFHEKDTRTQYREKWLKKN